MVWHMRKDDGDKDFQSSLPSNIQFDNFTIPCLLIWKIFADHGILCCKCCSPPGTTKIQHGVGINNVQSNMVWQNKICGYSLAYGWDVFPKLEISSKFSE